MDEEKRKNIGDLSKTLDKLGYGYKETCNLNELVDIVSDYVLDKVNGVISDFVVIPNPDGMLSGLGKVNMYKIYIKKK